MDMDFFEFNGMGGSGETPWVSAGGDAAMEILDKSGIDWRFRPVQGAAYRTESGKWVVEGVNLAPTPFRVEI